LHAAWAINMANTLGERWYGPLAVVRNWTFCLFYVAAELWGSVVVSVLFWGFANSICLVDEAKKFYPFFGLCANVALIFSGQAVRYFSDVRTRLPPGVDGWQYSLQGMMSMVVVFGLLICLIRLYLQKSVVEKMTGNEPLQASKKAGKKKEKMSVGESFAYLAKSSYVRCMATLVISYGIAINLVEVTWKGRLKAQYPDPNDYSAFMGNFSTCTGICTFLLMIVSRGILARKKGDAWKLAASITPLVLGLTGILFFALILFNAQFNPIMAGLGVTPLFASVIVGAAQNIFSKSAKYSLFDPTKEMAYIPLDAEVATKAKAAIDVICNPLGKSGGAFIQQILILITGSLAASTPFLGIFLLGIIWVWLGAIGRLAIEFSNKQAENALKKVKEAGSG
jgi:ATP:ADP antiporter, AAA family